MLSTALILRIQYNDAMCCVIVAYTYVHVKLHVVQDMNGMDVSSGQGWGWGTVSFYQILQNRSNDRQGIRNRYWKLQRVYKYRLYIVYYRGLCS